MKCTENRVRRDQPIIIFVDIDVIVVIVVVVTRLFGCSPGLGSVNTDGVRTRVRIACVDGLIVHERERVFCSKNYVQTPEKGWFG